MRLIAVDEKDPLVSRSRASEGLQYPPHVYTGRGASVLHFFNEKQEPAILVELQFDAVAVWVSDVQRWSLAKSPTDALELLLDHYVGLP